MGNKRAKRWFVIIFFSLVISTCVISENVKASNLTKRLEDLKINVTLPLTVTTIITSDMNSTDKMFTDIGFSSTEAQDFLDSMKDDNYLLYGREIGGLSYFTIQGLDSDLSYLDQMSEEQWDKEEAMKSIQSSMNLTEYKLEDCNLEVIENKNYMFCQYSLSGTSTNLIQYQGYINGKQAIFTYSREGELNQTDYDTLKEIIESIEFDAGTKTTVSNKNSFEEFPNGLFGGIVNGLIVAGIFGLGTLFFNKIKKNGKKEKKFEPKSSEDKDALEEKVLYVKQDLKQLSSDSSNKKTDEGVNDSMSEIIPDIWNDNNIASKEDLFRKPIPMDHEKNKQESPIVTVVGVNGNHKNQVFTVTAFKSLVFGRNPEIAQVCYAEDKEGISSIHCSIAWMDGRYYLTDLKSSYGTFLHDGTKLQPKIPYPISDQMIFYLANQSNMFFIEIGQ